MRLNVTSNADQVARSLKRAQRQIPFATARALTETAKDGRKAEQRRLERVLDRPTPFTKRGVAIRSASKRQLRARIFYKDVQAGYLEILEKGGTRTPEGRALLVPVGARVNKYGNLSRNQVARLLARPNVFSGQVGRAAGIFQVMRSGRVKLLVAYESRARYRPQLGFRRAAEKRARRAFPVKFRAAFREALRTAR